MHSHTKGMIAFFWLLFYKAKNTPKYMMDFYRESDVTLLFYMIPDFIKVRYLNWDLERYMKRAPKSQLQKED